MRGRSDDEDPASGDVDRRPTETLVRLRDWMLLDVNRYLLALGPLGVGFALFVWLEFSGVIDIGRSTTPMLYLFSALAGGNVTLITIVISINQLILSRELRSPLELQTEMDAAADYRDSVEAETERRVVPEEPHEFLRMLTRDTLAQLGKLDDAAAELEAAPPRADIDELVVNLGTELEGTIARLERARGVFPALSTVLDADFSTRINHSRWIRRAYADSVPDATGELLEGLEQRLEQLDVARQYYKTIYIKQELADLSKLVMISGLLSVLVAITALVFTGYRTAPLSYLQELLVVPVAVTVNLVPLALLVSHVFRISTVSRRTAAITPFLEPTG